MTPEAIIIAILGIFPHMSQNNRQCIIDRTPQITQQLQEVGEPIEPGAAVPPRELTAAVAFLETHLGCDRFEGGNWGAPINARQRHVPGNHMSAVRILVRGYRTCGTWEGSVMRFRTGLCNPRRQSSNRHIQTVGPRYLRRVQDLQARMVAYRDRRLASNTH